MAEQPDRIRIWNEEIGGMTEPMTIPTMLRALGDFPGEPSAYDHLVFMRNTGVYSELRLGDVNQTGREIFDGDLITHSIEPYVYRVVQKRGCWWAISLRTDAVPARLLNNVYNPRIVGNVFENRELLMKGEINDE